MKQRPFFAGELKGNLALEGKIYNYHCFIKTLRQGVKKYMAAWDHILDPFFLVFFVLGLEKSLLQQLLSMNVI